MSSKQIKTHGRYYTKVGVPQSDLTPATMEEIEKQKADLQKRRAELFDEDQSKVIAYNSSLFVLSPEIEKLSFIGNRVIVRLFKLPKVKSSGLILSNFTKVETEGGKMKAVEDKFQFQYRGVVVAIGEHCSEQFTKSVQVGDVIQISHNSPLGQFQFYPDKEDVGAEFDNYFKFNESHIECVEKTK